MADPQKRHPVWRGQLRLALVSCPVALYTAHQTRNELHFNFINPATGNRVRMVTVDAGTDEEVSRKDLSRGYEIGKDQYVLLDDADFEHARIDSSSLLSIDKFVPADAIDPVYYDASYYLAPDDATGADVFVVLRDAIRKTGKVALSRVVISRRERAVAIMPMERGLVLHTLHDAGDIAAPGDLFAAVPEAEPDPEMVQLAVQLVDRQAAAFDPADMEDRYAARLRQVIDAKASGQTVEPEEEEPDRSNVVDLMAALKRSLGDAAPAKPKPAAKKPAAKPKAAQKKPAPANATAKAAAKPKSSPRPARKRA